MSNSGKKLATNDRKWATPGRRNKLTPKKWEKVLETLEETGNLEASAATNGISVSTVYKYMERCPEAKEEYEIARNQACMRLEKEAYRRAVEGTSRAVYFQGSVVGYETEYSDKLLSDLMKANMPHRFSNKTELNVNHQHDLSGDAKAKLASLLNLSDQSNDGEIYDAEYTEVDDEDQTSE